MIHTGIPRAEASDLVAKGGRILKHYLDAKRNPICDVQTANDGTDAPPPPPPPEAAEPSEKKKRGRPAKAPKG